MNEQTVLRYIDRQTDNDRQTDRQVAEFRSVLKY